MMAARSAMALPRASMSLCNLLLIVVSALLLVLPRAARAANFSLSHEVSGDQFFDEFYWWSYDGACCVR
jgi:hypothetical protein